MVSNPGLTTSKTSTLSSFVLVRLYSYESNLIARENRGRRLRRWIKETKGRAGYDSPASRALYGIDAGLPPTDPDGAGRHLEARRGKPGDREPFLEVTKVGESRDEAQHVDMIERLGMQTKDPIP